MTRPDGLVRTRDGDLIEDVDAEPAPHRCDRGWIDVAEGFVAPCPRCRPKTYARINHQEDSR